MEVEIGFGDLADEFGGELGICGHACPRYWVCERAMVLSVALDQGVCCAEKRRQTERSVRIERMMNTIAHRSGICVRSSEALPDPKIKFDILWGGGVLCARPLEKKSKCCRKIGIERLDLRWVLRKDSAADQTTHRARQTETNAQSGASAMPKKQHNKKGM